MKKLFPLTILLLLTGCIADPAYDLSKLDTEMTVLKNAEFRIPDTGFFSLDDFFSLQGIDYLVTDENGDYRIRFALDPVTVTARIPYVDEDGRIPAEDGEVRFPVQIDPVGYTFASVPDFLSGEGQSFLPDLSEMEANLHVHSDIPANLLVGASIEARRKGEVQFAYDFQDIHVPEGDRTFRISEDPYSDLPVPGLWKSLSPIPDELYLHAVDVRLAEDRVWYGSVNTPYDLTLEASFDTPLLFPADTRFTMTIPLGAELNLEQIGLKRADLNFTWDSTIPLDLSVKLYALDADGNRIDGIKVEMNGIEAIQQGYGSGILTLTADTDLRFSDLVMELTASANPMLSRICLNKAQRIRFIDMYLYLPDGVQIRLDETK